MKINNAQIYMLTSMCVRSGLQSCKTYEVVEVCAWVKKVWAGMRMGEKAFIIEHIQRSLKQDVHLPNIRKQWRQLLKFCMVHD